MRCCYLTRAAAAAACAKYIYCYMVDTAAPCPIRLRLQNAQFETHDDMLQTYVIATRVRRVFTQQHTNTLTHTHIATLIRACVYIRALAYGSLLRLVTASLYDVRVTATAFIIRTHTHYTHTLSCDHVVSPALWCSYVCTIRCAAAVQVLQRDAASSFSPGECISLFASNDDNDDDDDRPKWHTNTSCTLWMWYYYGWQRGLHIMRELCVDSCVALRVVWRDTFFPPHHTTKKSPHTNDDDRRLIVLRCLRQTETLWCAYVWMCTYYK